MRPFDSHRYYSAAESRRLMKATLRRPVPREPAAGPLELGYTTAEVVGMVRAAAMDGAELGHSGKALLSYLSIRCPLLPGSNEMRTWGRERRRLVGRLVRCRESRREFVGYLPLA
jgi:hypothetical protein